MSDRPWLERYDEGVPQTIDYPQVPLFYFLEEAAKKYPDAPCTIFKGAKISYSEMVERTDRFAAALVSLGVKKGDRVGIFVLNTPQFVVAYFGALKIGAIVVEQFLQHDQRSSAENKDQENCCYQSQGNFAPSDSIFVYTVKGKEIGFPC